MLERQKVIIRLASTVSEKAISKNQAKRENPVKILLQSAIFFLNEKLSICVLIKKGMHFIAMCVKCARVESTESENSSAEK